MIHSKLANVDRIFLLGHLKGRQVCLTMCKLSSVLETIIKESDQKTQSLYGWQPVSIFEKLNDRQLGIHVHMHTGDLLALNDFSCHKR